MSEPAQLSSVDVCCGGRVGGWPLVRLWRQRCCSHISVPARLYAVGVAVVTTETLSGHWSFFRDAVAFATCLTLFWAVGVLVSQITMLEMASAGSRSARATLLMFRVL